MIGQDGVAPYIRQNNKDSQTPETPVVETGSKTVELDSRPGSHIHIPSHLIPTDEEAAKLFDLYFMHIHPFWPVLSRSQFYDQWNHHRESISPLLLAAVFACGARVSDEPTTSLPWLTVLNSTNAFMLVMFSS